jgi:hypothetical protein
MPSQSRLRAESAWFTVRALEIIHKGAELVALLLDRDHLGEHVRDESRVIPGWV